MPKKGWYSIADGGRSLTWNGSRSRIIWELMWSSLYTYHIFAGMAVFLTSHISWSEYKPRGSKLLRTVPLKRVGSWGIILSLVLRSLRPMEQISNLSISILPPAGSTRRNNELISVDFPLPVLPTTPILFPATKVQVIRLRTSGAFGRYLICSSSTSH